MREQVLVKSKKYLTHDEEEVCKVGDEVVIQLGRPISATKRFSFVKKLRSARVE